MIPFIAFMGCCSVAGVSTAAARLRLAPADEYFGPTKMSPLEITNRIHDAEIRGASYPGLISTQAAIEDWTHKYPADPWIAPREYRMSRLFQSLHSREGSTEAAHCRAFLHSHFRLH
ncbi:MAG TPA: hypothetical protein VKR05_04345 [Candidatus Cybelea sp.]|nr:hypothetical protein [Candidatus Cybelea sp.]